MAQPSRISGISSGSVSKEIAPECWPPAVLAMASRRVRLDQVEGGGADADHRHRGGIDQREQAAEAEADRLAGLAEGLALGTVVRARACAASASMSASLMSATGSSSSLD